MPPEVLFDTSRSMGKKLEEALGLLFLVFFPPQRRSEEEALCICTYKPRVILLEGRTPSAMLFRAILSNLIPLRMISVTFLDFASPRCVPLTFTDFWQWTS